MSTASKVRTHKNPKNPFVSVVIPAFNEENFIAKTLESLLFQNFTDFEIIVVDNNSTDRTAEIAKRFGAIILFEPRQSVSCARQRGFSAAKGKIIASTDADTVLPPDWLADVVSHFEKDEKLVAVGGLSFLYSGPLMTRLFSFYFLYPFLVLDKKLSGGWNLIGSNFAVRKTAFLKTGGFDTELILNEDIEISDRLRKIGSVILDTNLRVKVSGRRYRNGLVLGLLDYLPSTIMRFLFKKYNKFMKLTPIRVEKPSVNKGLVLMAVSFFLLFFYFLSPVIIQADSEEFLKRGASLLDAKVDSARNTIKNHEQILKDFIHIERR